MHGKRSPHLPGQTPRTYPPVGRCIYCGTTANLTREHIIPLAAGGRWILPQASCRDCAAITGAFEGECSRTILGPLRMFYDLPTRRPKERPKHLPIKVKYPTSTDWEIAYVDRSICPFLIGLPLYPLPSAITGIPYDTSTCCASDNFWIRGVGFWRDDKAHMQWLCNALGAVEIMPIATIHTEPFCLMLAKIAHAYAIAELGIDTFTSYLQTMILSRDFTDRPLLIGGGAGNEPPHNDLHDISIEDSDKVPPNVIAVRVRLLAAIGTPTYHVVVGHRRTPKDFTTKI